MARQVGLIALLVFLLSALVALDFKAAQRTALAEHRPSPSFAGHLIDIGGRIVTRIGNGFGQGAADGSERLTLMLPAVPEGWEQRAIKDGDATALLARSPKDNDPATVSLIESVLATTAPQDGEAAQRVFAKGDRLVVFKLVRQPDALFSDPERLADLDALIATRPAMGSQGFIRVRGLDVTELALPEKLRARLFTAELGGQLRLWVLSSGRMGDDALVPFFETLDVAAMNAAARSREDGLGSVPVIVLVSDLGADDRAAYETDRDTRARADEAELQAMRAALADRQDVTEGLAPGREGRPDGCKTTAIGVTICTTEG